MADVTQEDYRPIFFKIILGSKERLRIPPKFLHHISKDLTNTATLKISSGDIWTVEMNRNKNGVFMEDGWQQFLRDNSLTDKHLLVFNYDGNMSFSVQIFEPSGVERVYDAATQCTTMPPPEEAAGHLNNGKRPRGRPKKNPVPTPHHHLPPPEKNLRQVKKVDIVKKVKDQNSSKPEKKMSKKKTSLK